MKKSYLIGGLVAIFLTSFFITGCKDLLNEDNKIPPNCYDGILNNDEYLLDCGGPNCPACFHCIDNIFQPELGETWLDCGGECGECPSCGNGIQDGDEFGIDCGGSCNNSCEDLCFDGLLNGNEDEVDCGGACEPCPLCTDLDMNGDEIGIDCGGGECPPCATEGNCTNQFIDGDELWVDCGCGGVGYCPACDTIMTWKVGGETYTCSPEDITWTPTFDGTGDILVTGAALQGGLFTLKLAEPATEWQTGVEGIVDPGTVPASLFATTTPTNEQYQTGFGNGHGIYEVHALTEGPCGIVRISFSGTLYMADGISNISVTNGLLMYPID